jgi:hypothetical protein
MYNPFCKIRHLVQIDAFKKLYLILFSKWSFFKILNIKWKITIMLITLQNKISIINILKLFVIIY